MKDLERLHKALQNLSEAITQEENSLGVDQDEYWMRSATIVVEKIKQRALRFSHQSQKESSFIFDLLLRLGSFDEAKTAFEKDFNLRAGHDLDQDIEDIRFFAKVVSQAGINFDKESEQLVSVLKRKYPDKKTLIVELMDSISSSITT